MKDVIKKAASAVAEAKSAISKRAVPFKSYPLQDASTTWNWTPEEFDALLDDSNWGRVASAHTWFDESADENNPPQAKGAYKLPHHYWRGGEVVTNWRGVVAAMGALLGARGGVDVPDGDRRAIYDHLAQHYAEFGREAPPFDSKEAQKSARSALAMAAYMANRRAKLVKAYAVGPHDALDAFSSLPGLLLSADEYLSKSDVGIGAFNVRTEQDDAFHVVADAVYAAFRHTDHWDALAPVHSAMKSTAEYDLGELQSNPVIFKADTKGEAGVHLHKLENDRRKTSNDGQHSHLYLIGDKVVATAVDGEHEHGIDAGASRSSDKTAKHAHTVKLPNGEAMETDEDGEHDHDMQVATTAWDGSHQHRLKLPDGSTVMSMTVAEFAERFGRDETPAGESADSEETA